MVHEKTKMGPLKHALKHSLDNLDNLENDNDNYYSKELSYLFAIHIRKTLGIILTIRNYGIIRNFSIAPAFIYMT